MRKALLFLILLTLVACSPSGTGVQNNSDPTSPDVNSQIVKDFDINRYMTDVLAELEYFDPQAFAKHLKSNEDNEVLQKLKFRAGILYYLTALNTLDRLRGGGHRSLSKEEVERRYLTFSDSLTEVESLSFQHREKFLPTPENYDPMNMMPSDQKIYDNAFARKKDFNCYRFFNNFNSLINDSQKSMAQLILLKNNTSYTGVDSFRGGLAELVKKDAFGEHFSHWWKTGALTDKARREQNLLMHQARLDALDMLLRANIIYSVNHAEGGGNYFDQGTCVSDPEEKAQWHFKITELALKLEHFYSAYFGAQSIKSRGETLTKVAMHAKDKVLWENKQLWALEGVLFLPGLGIVGSLGTLGAKLVGKNLAKVSAKRQPLKEVVENNATKAVNNTTKSKSAKFKNAIKTKTKASFSKAKESLKALRSEYVKNVETLSDFFEFVVVKTASGVFKSGRWFFSALKKYTKDSGRIMAGKTEGLSGWRVLGVGGSSGALLMLAYIFGEEAIKDDLSHDYKPMLNDYRAEKDYAVIEDDLRLSDTGEISRPISPEEWVDYNMAVEEFLNSHTQSPKVYFALMQEKYDFLNEIDKQQISFIYDLFPNMKEDIRRHGDIDSTINYYLQLENELSEALGIEDE